MKNKIFYAIVGGLFAAALAFGIFFRFSYTNITAEENYLDKLDVGELPEELCIGACRSMAQELPASPIILRVSPTDEIEHHFGRSVQRVTVSQVFAGEELAVGDEFYLTCVRWSVFVRSDGQAIERGFVNILREGSDYLVFLLTDSGMENRGLPLYFLNIDQFIAPVFCYEDIANTFVTPAGRTTYVPYTQVKDNEFFAAAQAGLDAWSALKQEMLRKYPAA